jgi:hypothetical protein
MFARYSSMTARRGEADESCLLPPRSRARVSVGGAVWWFQDVEYTEWGNRAPGTGRRGREWPELAKIYTGGGGGSEEGGGAVTCEGVGEGLGFLWMRLAQAGRT